MKPHGREDEFFRGSSARVLDDDIVVTTARRNGSNEETAKTEARIERARSVAGENAS
jgi:hypothetical protein